MCQGLNSHYFHVIGDGHQPYSRGLYTHYKDSLLKVGGLPSPIQTIESTLVPYLGQFFFFVLGPGGKLVFFPTKTHLANGP